MKRILTLFVMLLATAGILSAQTQKFSYQAVVRNHDNVTNQDTLVHDTDIDMTVSILNGADTIYKETHEGVTTTQNGMVSVLIGKGLVLKGNMNNVDWSAASITVDFKMVDGSILTSTMQVQPVPYAIQAAGGKFTTDQIVDYVQNNLTYDDVLEILAAIVNNPNGLKDGLKDTVINYVKAHKDIAKEVAEAYVQHLKGDHVREFYDAVRANTGVKNQIKLTIYDYILNHQEVVKEIVVRFLETASAEDVNDAYAALQSMPTATKQAIKARMVSYVKNHRDLAAQLVLFYVTSTDSTEASLVIEQLRNENHNGVRNQLRDSLNVIIDRYMSAHQGTIPSGGSSVTDLLDSVINSRNFVSDSLCQGIDLCDLDSRIDDLVATACPTLGNTTLEEMDNRILVITPYVGTLVSGAQATYTVSVDGTDFPFVAENNVSNEGNNFACSIDLPTNNFMPGTTLDPGKTLTVTLSITGCGVSGSVTGTPVEYTIPYSCPTSKPTISGVSNTEGNSDAKTILFQNKGVILKSKIDGYSTFANSISKQGYLLSRNSITDYDPDLYQVVEVSQVVNDSIYYTVGFDSCGGTIYYRPFVQLLGCDSPVLGTQKSFEMWAPDFTVSANPTSIAAGSSSTVTALAEMQVDAWNLYGMLAVNLYNSNNQSQGWGCPALAADATVQKPIETWMYILNTVHDCQGASETYGSTISSILFDPANVDFRYMLEGGENTFSTQDDSDPGVFTVNPAQTTTYTAKAVLTYDGVSCIVKDNVTVTVQ